jgi:hypothetical protein
MAATTGRSWKPLRGAANDDSYARKLDILIEMKFIHEVLKVPDWVDIYMFLTKVFDVSGFKIYDMGRSQVSSPKKESPGRFKSPPGVFWLLLSMTRM